ncbi:5-hydroxytryptamine receptor 1D-like [Rhopilema esculentum]|uniref:5-hydroxytryptamine receptor 1D-like n=1 Tax=Rhopilema esculentum TaxID=499914 RepID=UPI0031D73375|eukprot:gene14210-5220_t
MEMLSNSSNGTTQKNLASVQRSTNVYYGLNLYDYILIAIAVCIVIMNSYVVSVFLRKKNLRRNSSLLLLSLALADLFTGLVTVPLIIAGTVLRQIDFNRFIIVFLLGDVATVLSASLTILSLCAITMDRYARLCFPVRHFVLLQRQRVITVFCMIWVVAISYSLIPFAWLHMILQDNPSEETYEAVISHDTRYATAGAIIFIVPVLGLTAAFTHMFYAIQKLGSNERRRSIRQYEESLRRKRERKAVIIFVLMFAAFVICWAPWIILRPFSDDVFSKIPVHFLNVAMLIRFLTSIFNPLMYTLQEAEFSRAFMLDKNILVAFFRCQSYNSRRGTFSGETDSFYKRSFLKSSGKGSSIQKDESHHEPANIVYSPVVHNGHLHPGDLQRENIKLQSLKQREVENDQNLLDFPYEGTKLLPQLVLREPSLVNISAVNDPSGEENSINADEVSGTTDRFKAQIELPKKLMTQTSIYDNVENISKCDAKTESVMFKASEDILAFKDWGNNEAFTDETEKMLQDGWGFGSGDCTTTHKPALDAHVENIKNDRTQKTAELLKISFIGKLFDANNLQSQVTRA